MKYTIQTKFKPVSVECLDGQICSINLVDNQDNDSSENPPFPELTDYFNGKKVDFNHLKLDLSCYPSFSRLVLEKCRGIPYGETITYAELAKRVGRPKAYRAVGSALGKNKYPIIIPCHRVLGSNHKLGGFSAGPGWKEFLLVWEKQHI